MDRPSIDDILNRLHALQDELEKEIDELLTEKRQLFRYTLERGKVRFDKSMKALQRHQKTGVLSYLFTAKLSHVLTAPFIYSLIFPFLLLDLMVSLYQHVCFRAYGIPRVKRKDYFITDRHQLAYLNIIEKINCVYCGYGNSLIEYTREISARTEQYWCPIKHARRSPDPHRYVENFVDYGDVETYKKQLEKLRKEISKLDG